MSNLDPAITQLIDAGRERIDQQRAEQQAKRDAEAAKRQAQLNEQRAGLHKAVMALLPEALHPYCRLLDVGSELLKYARLEVPGCSPITITVKVNSYWDNTNGKPVRVTNYLPVKSDTNPLFNVERYQLAFDYDEGVYSVTELIDTNFGSNDIDVALAAAAEQAAQQAALTAEAHTKNEQLQAAQQAAEAHTKNEQLQAAQQAADDRRLALITKIIDDDLAVRLVELFLAIQTEREKFTKTVQDASEYADIMAERYERSLAQQQRDAERAIRSTKDDVERAQREADDLQAQLDRIKRQAQYA